MIHHFDLEANFDNQKNNSKKPLGYSNFKDKEEKVESDTPIKVTNEKKNGWKQIEVKFNSGQQQHIGLGIARKKNREESKNMSLDEFLSNKPREFKPFEFAKVKVKKYKLI